ncbi:MAG: hotdog fold thioesterase [Rhizobacter sp.]|nr:hotdog fold thioesterase [Chlorobiales bacterium]
MLNLETTLTRIFPEHVTAASLNGSRLTEGGMAEHIGIEFVEVGANFITAKMPVDHRTRQPMGLLHGGASVALAETIASVAAYCLLDWEKQYAVGLEINANHIRSARDGYVYGTATPLHIGKTTQVWQTEIRDDHQNLICISRMTVAILNK